MKMRIVLVRDQTAHSVQSDFDLHCPQKLLSVVISKERVNKDGVIVWQRVESNVGQVQNTFYIFFPTKLKHKFLKICLL